MKTAIGCTPNRAMKWIGRSSPYAGTQEVTS